MSGPEYALTNQTFGALLQRDKPALAADQLSYVVIAPDVAQRLAGIEGAMDTYIPQSDITEELPDGRLTVVAPAGVPIPINQAKALGLVKDEPPATSREKKA